MVIDIIFIKYLGFILLAFIFIALKTQRNINLALTCHLYEMMNIALYFLKAGGVSKFNNKNREVINNIEAFELWVKPEIYRW